MDFSHPAVDGSILILVMASALSDRLGRAVWYISSISIVLMVLLVYIFRKLTNLSVLLAGLSFSTAHSASIIDGVSAITDRDIRESAIAFVNMSTSPGVEGATISLDTEGRQSDQWRASVGFGAEYTIRSHVFNGYWGLAAIGGSLDDRIDLLADDGQPVRLEVNRTIYGLRGSAGLVFPINQHVKLRPYVSLVVSEMPSTVSVSGAVIGGVPGQSINVSTAQLLSTVGTIDALYSRWYGDNRLELAARYNLIYTDSFSADNPILSTIAWNHTFQVESMYSGPTGLTSDGRQWRWEGFFNYTTFMSQDTTSLGYKNYFEAGGGLAWEVNIKPLDWFGWQSVGLSAGIIFGKDIDGFNVGLTAR